LVAGGDQIEARPAPPQSEETFMEDFREILLASQKDQKGVQLYVNGQTIS
jgi:hypothetical protein